MAKRHPPQSEERVRSAVAVVLLVIGVFVQLLWFLLRFVVAAILIPFDEKVGYKWYTLPIPRRRKDIEDHRDLFFRRVKGLGGVAHDAVLDSFEVGSPGEEPGKAEQTFTVSMKWHRSSTGDSFASTFIVKCGVLRTPFLVRLIAAAAGVSREVVFYDQVQTHASAPSPRALVSTSIPILNRHFVIVEHVEGQTVTDSKGASLEQAVQVMTAVGAMHAQYWERTATAPELRDLPVNDPAPLFELFKRKDLAKHHPTVRAFQRCVKKLPHTLCHGDCRLGNFLWVPVQRAAPQPFWDKPVSVNPKGPFPVLLDFEMTGPAPAAWDIAYFTWTSIEPEGSYMGRKEREMFDAWAKALSDGGVDIEAMEPPLWDQYQIMMLQVLSWCGYIAGALVTEYWKENNKADAESWERRNQKRIKLLVEDREMMQEISGILEKRQASPPGKPWSTTLEAMLKDAILAPDETLQSRMKKYSWFRT